MQDTSAIRIYTLGQFRMERFNGNEWLTVTDTAWQQRRVRVLLCSLISSPRRTMSRERLLDEMKTLGESDNPNGRLDRAVYNLRQLFEPTRSKLAPSQLWFASQFVPTGHDMGQKEPGHDMGQSPKVVQAYMYL